MAKAKFDITTTARKPFYAGVGVTDLAVEAVREAVVDAHKRFTGVQKDVEARVADVQKTVRDPKVLREQAASAVNSRVDALAQEARTRRAAVESRVAELQAEAKAYPGRVQKDVEAGVASATETYTELVKRGEALVTRIRRQESTQAAVANAKSTTTKAKTTGTQAKKAASTGAKSSATTAKTTGTQARKTAKTAAKTSTTAAKQAASKTTSTAKRSAAASRGTTAKKTSTATSSGKATATAAKKTASSAAQATTEAAKKVGN